MEKYKKYFNNLTKLSNHNAHNNKKSSNKLKFCNISFQNKFVKTRCDDCTEAAQNNPYRGWH